MDELPELAKVKITCTSKDCENGHHLYRPPRGQWEELAEVGVCQACGDTSVDMSVTRTRNIAQPGAIFAELGREFIRYVYLNRPIDARARRLIRRDGLDGVRAGVHARLVKSIGGEPDIWDGRQTSLTGNILHYAQHATATCCRRCAWYWYGISREGELSEETLAFCEGLIQAYLDRREGEMIAIAASPPDKDDDDGE